MNVNKTITPPDITVEPETPNGNNGWYKLEGDTEAKVKVTISTNNQYAEDIYFTAVGAYNETRNEETKAGKSKNITFTIENSGETEITARTVMGDSVSDPKTKLVKQDNIKPEIQNIEITPKPPKPGELGNDSLGRSWLRESGVLEIEAVDSKNGISGTGKVVRIRMGNDKPKNK